MTTVYYAIWNDFGDLGEGFDRDAVTDFDDAVDQFAECLEQGDNPSLWEIHPPTPDEAGMVIDVTEKAWEFLWHRPHVRNDPEFWKLVQNVE